MNEPSEVGQSVEGTQGRSFRRAEASECRIKSRPPEMGKQQSSSSISSRMKKQETITASQVLDANQTWGEDVCECVSQLVTFTSYTDENPARRFLRCRNLMKPWSCRFFNWIDAQLPHHQLEYIRKQKRAIAELKQENKRLKTALAASWVAIFGLVC